MKSFKIAVLSVVVGGVIGAGSMNLYSAHSMDMMSKNPDATSASSSNEPLYWVAPMDANYRRDKPGKSPMGMDLVPVYADDAQGEKAPVGTVTIDPSVVNNLGVKSAFVEKSILSPNIDTVGYIAFDESKLWQVNVRAAGWVEKLNINAIGERVNKGDVLFTLYSPELVKAQEELLNAYRTGRKGLVKGARERLYSLGVDKVQVNSIVRSGKANKNIEIKASSNGVIASLNIREGGYLSPSQIVITAGPLEDIWVDAEVFERQAHWLSSGNKAVMTLDAIPGKMWEGEVDYVYPILDPKTRTMRMRLKFDNQDGALKPNMFANITIQPKTKEEVLTIPRQSVIRSGGMTRVVLDEGNGKYRSARIMIGREAGNKAEVVKGLKENDKVVTSAQFLLDSESSKTAELSRINGQENSIWISGDITMLMADFGMVTFEHKAVAQWDWKAGEMNFSVENNIDLSAFHEGEAVQFLVQKDSDEFKLLEIEKEGEAL
ncbi:efflux RND transporter periplasmic adaptor subunit [Aliivibrio fischeri]|uniref:efflux RND transporter periplasmic adaptor subunit n=1 Tax=Aliivibrio fischeri TaxID=668 RepID=UPI0012DA4515|nr:efflux RND transporter periplasmic adaptor subunit [Aliivibrio fischeri]MUK71229.1 efflux RND transporter periplasmic adaptor subunit [Aliivibrio fischeri]MUK74449.1 efflux RND transporter periplasmic adaptor subunit [Aliivibrio fischeri]